MKSLRPLLASVLALALPLPAFAQPHTIAQLGTAPLIGQITSTSQLKNDVSRQRRLFETAGTKLGLSAAEYAKFSARIAAGNLAYVTIPRHLDAMSWSSGGNVYVLHDVIVPRGTKGWEVDLQENNETVALFVPARCGNLSIVRRPRPHVAKAPAVKAVAAVPPPTPAPSPAPDAAPAFVAPPAPQATPAPYAAVAQSTPSHHFRWWPLLLIPIAALLVSGHGGSGSTPAITTSTLPPPPAPPAPTPPPVGCTPAPSH